jgi:hypothetical protein
MTTVKEGWLFKKGEYVQNWRPRYFVLKSDGTFRGYKAQPQDGDFPINVFEVQNSTIQEIDQKKSKSSKFGFQVCRLERLPHIWPVDCACFLAHLFMCVPIYCDLYHAPCGCNAFGLLSQLPDSGRLARCIRRFGSCN